MSNYGIHRCIKCGWEAYCDGDIPMHVCKPQPKRLSEHLIYLASPYSHPTAAVRIHRYNEACRVSARLMAEGRIIYSPIAHSHPIADYMKPELLMDHEFWMSQCLPIVRLSRELWVLAIDGWKESRGVKREMDEAYIHNIPVGFVEP